MVLMFQRKGIQSHVRHGGKASCSDAGDIGEGRDNVMAYIGEKFMLA